MQTVQHPVLKVRRADTAEGLKLKAEAGAKFRECLSVHKEANGDPYKACIAEMRAKLRAYLLSRGQVN